MWRGDRLFEAQFFHLGFLYDRPVQINVVKDGVAAPLPYAADLTCVRGDVMALCEVAMLGGGIYAFLTTSLAPTIWTPNCAMTVSAVTSASSRPVR